MTKYDLETTEAAIARCQADLSGALADATEYAFVYDALLKDKEKTVPVLVFRMETRGASAATQFIQRYRLKKTLLSRKPIFVPQEDFQAQGPGAPWLI